MARSSTSVAFAMLHKHVLGRRLFPRGSLNRVGDDVVASATRRGLASLGAPIVGEFDRGLGRSLPQVGENQSVVVRADAIHMWGSVLGVCMG